MEGLWKKIREDEALKALFVEMLQEALAEHEEWVPTMMDADHVIDVFETHGKWSGVGYDYYFELEYGFICERRAFKIEKGEETHE